MLILLLFLLLLFLHWDNNGCVAQGIANIRSAVSTPNCFFAFSNTHSVKAALVALSVFGAFASISLLRDSFFASSVAFSCSIRSASCKYKFLFSNKILKRV